MSSTAPPQPAAEWPPPAAVQPVARAGFREDESSVPVSLLDPQWGRPDAPVTIVVFGDLRASTDRQAQAALQRLQATYGPGALRLVWKHAPAASSPESRTAAEAAVTVFTLNGSEAFWLFRDRALAQQAAVTPESFLQWATEAGVDPQIYTASVKLSGVSERVEQDLRLARQLGVQSTPEFFINGEVLRGAASFAAFKPLIDAQLGEARALVAGGTPMVELYATLTNRHRPPPAPKPAEVDASFIEASHILVQYAGAMRAPASITRSKAEARKRIAEVLAKVRGGADFAQMAVEYSDDPSAATRRGALGRFRKGMMVKPFQDAAFALEVGELSGIVETDFGYHVIKRTN